MTRKNAVLVDTGPLVASFNETDQWHTVCVNTLRSFRNPLVTAWPVITEAMYLLETSVRAQEGLWELMLSRGLLVLPLGVEDMTRMRELTRRYGDRPMDLADAALVRVAERERIGAIFNVDQRDFAIYRPIHMRNFQLLPKL